MALSQPWAITGLNASWLIISGLGVPLAGSRSLGPVVLSSTEATWQLGLAASLIGGLLNLFFATPLPKAKTNPAADSALAGAQCPNGSWLSERLE